MDCRKHEIRVELVSNYDISPVAHVKLLNGQEKMSCTGVILTDSYYCFSYRRKNTNDKLKSFFCGIHASNDFINLIGCDPIPLFNPLKSLGELAKNSTQTKGRNKYNNRKWNPLSKELSDAINILIIYWNITPTGAILDIKNKVDKYFYKAPFDNEIKGVNTIISKDKNQLSLIDMIHNLDVEGQFKRYEFPLLNDKVNELGVESKFI